MQEDMVCELSVVRSGRQGLAVMVACVQEDAGTWRSNWISAIASGLQEIISQDQKYADQANGSRSPQQQ